MLEKKTTSATKTVTLRQQQRDSDRKRFRQREGNAPATRTSTGCFVFSCRKIPVFKIQFTTKIQYNIIYRLSVIQIKKFYGVLDSYSTVYKHPIQCSVNKFFSTFTATSQVQLQLSWSYSNKRSASPTYCMYRSSVRYEWKLMALSFSLLEIRSDLNTYCAHDYWFSTKAVDCLSIFEAVGLVHSVMFK